MTAESTQVKGSPGDEYRYCTRKVRYSKKPDDEQMRAYRCCFCGGWHLTSKPKTGRQKLTAV